MRRVVLFFSLFMVCFSYGQKLQINKTEFEVGETIGIKYLDLPKTNNVQDYFWIVILREPHGCKPHQIPFLDATERIYSEQLKGNGVWEATIPSEGTFKVHLVRGRSSFDGISGVEYFTLKIKKKNLGVNDIQEAKEAKCIFPNPSKGTFVINAEKEITSAQVYGLDGTFVLATTSKQLDLTDQSNGTYLVVIQYTDGSTSSGRIIKQ